MPDNSNKPRTSSDKDRANHLEEWKKARDVLKSFDDKLHDLRKYGFSFVTALLTVEGILITGGHATTRGGTALSDGAKFAVFGVTLLLILALHLIDQNYRVYQRAANMRARILERKLNLELSETITDRYKAEDIKTRVLLLYFFFIVGVLLLGGFSLYPNWIYIGILLAAACAAIRLTSLLGTTFKYEYEEDWTISPLECTPTDKVTITLTNLREPVEIRIHRWMPSILEKILKEIRKKKGIAEELEPIKIKYIELNGELNGTKYFVWEKVPEPIIIKKGELVWQMINEESDERISKHAKGNLVIYDSHTWILKRDDFTESGTYRLHPRGWPVPLQRRITVSGKEKPIWAIEEKTEEEGEGEKTEKKGKTAGN